MSYLAPHMSFLYRLALSNLWITHQAVSSVFAGQAPASHCPTKPVLSQEIPAWTPCRGPPLPSQLSRPASKTMLCQEKLLL